MIKGYLKISYHNNDFFDYFIWATESFIKIIKYYDLWERMLDDDVLLDKLKVCFNNLFNCYYNFDITIENKTSHIKMEVDDFMVVCEDEILCWDNEETIYISLNPYDDGYWFIV